MPAPLSVVIPTYRAAAELPATLAALLPGLEAGLIRDLVISDAGSEDRTAEIAEAAGAQMITGPASRGGQLRRGVEAAQGDWVMLLHADTHLSSDWPEAAAAHIAGYPDAAGVFRLRFRAEGAAPRLVESWANLRAARLGLPYGDQGFVVSRAALDAVGGVPDQPLMEDVALARAFRGRLRLLDATAATSAARYRARGWMRQGSANLWRLTRYLAGADPARLARGYRSSSR